MKKKDIVNLIELNKKILDGNRYKKIAIPEFDELKEELDILKREVQEGIKIAEEARERIKKCTCDHSVRFHYPGGWGYRRDDECVFCGKGFEADNVHRDDTIYEDINRNRYCVRFTTNYFYDCDSYCDNAYNENEVYDLLLKVINDIDDDEEIDFVQLLKNLNIKDCKVDERRKEKTHYILIVGGSNKYGISDRQYITSDRIPLVTNFINLLVGTPGIRLEVFGNEETFKSKEFTERIDTSKSRNIRCVSYQTTDELMKGINNEKNVPFNIIIDMSSLYEYRVDNGKIISDKVNIDFNEIFPNSYVIKIDDFGNKEQKELLEILKERLIAYNEAYGYIRPKKHFFGNMNDEDDFYNVNDDKLVTSDVMDVYKNIRRILVNR